MNNKVIVTGGSGFIGGHLVDKLIGLGHEVHVVDNLSSGTYVNPTAKYHFLDIGNCDVEQDLVPIIKNAKCVFHLAAKARVQPSFTDPVGYHSTNVTGTLNLLEACKLTGVKNFVFSSSSSVYGSGYDNEPLQEFDELFPESPYSFNKVIGELYCKFYQTHFNMDIKVLRYFNVYGDRMIVGGQYAQAIQIFLNNYRKGEPFKVFGDGNQRRDFTHVSDVVQANIKAMNLGHNINSIFNIGTGINYSINELCNMIGGNIEYLPAKIEPKYTLANNHYAETVLKWTPKIKLPEWIKGQL